MHLGDYQGCNVLSQCVDKLRILPVGEQRAVLLQSRPDASYRDRMGL